MPQEKISVLRARFEQDMFDGFVAGLHAASPEPGPEASASYRHGFNNARDDLRHSPRAPAAWLRVEAEKCIVLDIKLSKFIK